MEGIRRWRWLVLALALLAALAVVGAGCGDDDDDDDEPQQGEQREFPAGTTMAKLQQEGRITIGVKFDVPPFGFKNPQTNEVEGFDVDLGKAVADELGVRPRFIEAITDNRIPFLKRGTADLILSTLTITTERDKEIDFSDPYYIARGRILVPKGSDIQGLEDLAGNKVCTALGSTYEETLRKRAKDAELRLVDTYSECLELIQNEAVDAVSTDDVILTGMIIQDDNLQLVGKQLTTEPLGAGIKDGDREFQQFVNEVIADFKSDGRWQKAYEKWVGQHTGEDLKPPTLTREEALKVAP